MLPLVHIYIDVYSPLIVNFYFRTQKKTLKRLKKTLSASSKSRRHQRNMLNIMVTVLAWLIELFGFLFVFIGTHILGHQNQVVNLLLQTLTNFFYFVLVPLFLLINDTDKKGRFAESQWYVDFLRKIHCQYTEQDKDKKEDEESTADENSIMEAEAEINQDREDIIAIDNEANQESDHADIEQPQNCFQRVNNQIDDTDTNKIDDGTHDAYSTNVPSNHCEIIDLE